MSTKKFGIVAGLVFALSIVLSPAASACSLQDLSSCDNDGLMALIVQMLAGQTTTTTTTTTETAPTVTGLPAGFQFNTNLKLGSTGNDVKYLQILLNADSATAVGNAGSETSYFGSMTQAAVVKFQNKYASEVLTPYGLSAGTGFFGTSSRAKANALLGSLPTTPGTTLPAGCTSTSGFSTTTGQRCDSGVSVTLPAGCTSTAGFSPITGERCDSGAVTPGTPTTGAGMTVSVASGSPAGTTLVEEQAIAPLAKYTLVNSDSVEAKITKVELQRIGVSADTTLKNVYLYDGDTRLTDSATISQGKVTFNNPNGVITIPAGTSKVITVVSDIDVSTSGQTVGVSLTDLTANVDLKSTMPVTGGIQTIASANLAKVTVGAVTPAVTVPATEYTVNAGTANYTIFSAPLTVSTRDVNLKGLTLKMIGSIPTDALENIQLYVNGVAAGNATVIDSNNMVRFDISNPVTVRTGTIEVRANIVKGSSRNFSFSLENAADLVLVDSVYNVYVPITGIPASTGTVTINYGSVSVTTDSTFNTTSITAGASNVVLAKYNLKAFGEDVKVNNLKIASSKALDNLTVYVNGAAATSSQNVATDGEVKTFSMGSSLIIPANTTVSLEVRGDTKKAGVNVTGGVEITLKAYVSNNAQGVSSSQLIQVPTSDISSQSLTSGVGTAKIAVSSTFPDGNITPNTQNRKIGSYVIQAGDSEAIRINNIRVDLTATNINNLSNLYIKYGSNQSKPVSPQSQNNFPVIIEVEKNQSLTVEVYADTGSLSATGSTLGTVVNVTSAGTSAIVGIPATASLALAGVDGNTFAVMVNGRYYATPWVTDINGTAAALAALIVGDTDVAAAVASTNSIAITGTADAGPLTITNQGSLPSSTVTVTPGTTGIASTDGTQASGTVTIDGTPVAGDMVALTVGGKEYKSAALTAGMTPTEVADAVDNLSISGYTLTHSAGVVTVTATSVGTPDPFLSARVIQATGSVQSTLNVGATGASSSTTVAITELAGQLMTIKSATLNSPILAVSSSPSAQYVLAANEGPVANYNFKSTDGEVTINEIEFTITNPATVTSITVGGVKKEVNSETTTVTGLSIPVPAYYSGVSVPVSVTYNTVGFGGGAKANTTSLVKISKVKYTAGNTQLTITPTPAVEAKTMTLVGGVPTAVLSPSTRTGLTTARTLLAEVTVGALSGTRAGQIAVQELPLTISKSTGLLFGATGATDENNFLVKVKGSTSDLATVSGQVKDGKVTFTTPYVIDAGSTTTFEISAVVSDLGSATNQSITVELGAAKNFKWKDVSGDISDLTGDLVAGYQTGNTTLIKVSN